MQSYWKLVPVTDEKLKNAAECWNKVGQMTKEYDVQTLLHNDFLCAVHSTEDLGKLLEYTNPDYVGLALDTAEAVVAGNDPVQMYEKFHDRVKLMHFKDAHEVDAAEEYINKHADTHLLHGGGLKGVERWFWEMGTPEGLVDFPALMRSLKNHKTKGWIIVESDHSPHPPESAMCNSWYITNVLSKIYK
jgi:inosose dehydratase